MAVPFPRRSIVYSVGNPHLRSEEEEEETNITKAPNWRLSYLISVAFIIRFGDESTKYMLILIKKK